ncbi:MAG: alpha/beta fold hydrolase [Nitriliruptoraceae bacterium]
MTTPDPTPKLLLPSELDALGARRRWVEVPGGWLAVAELGPADAPAWVLAHGVGSSARFLAAAFARPVLDAGARLVVSDLRGHGASLPARRSCEHHLDVHAADLAAVVASVEGPVAVTGGVSLGAHAAVRAATTGTRAGAVVGCLPAWLGLSSRGRGPHAAVAARVTREGIGPMIAELRADHALAPWLRATLLADYPRHDPASLEAALRALDGAEAPSVAELRALEPPLAVIGWPDDPGHPLAVARRWSDLAPRSALARMTIASLEGQLSRLGRAAVVTVRSLRPDGDLGPPAPLSAPGRGRARHERPARPGHDRAGRPSIP